MPSTEGSSPFTTPHDGVVNYLDQNAARRFISRIAARRAISWHLHLDVADLGRDRLGIVAVTRVLRVAARDVVTFIAEMLLELGVQHGQQHLTDHRRRQAVVARQFHALSTRASRQLVASRMAGRNDDEWPRAVTSQVRTD